MRKVFLDELPRWEKGGKAKEGSINWILSEKHKVRFIYDDIEGELEIISCYINKQQLKIKYNNKEFFIKRGDFQRCNLARILGKRTTEFKYKKGTILKDDRRDITIVDIAKIPRCNKDGSIKGYDKYYKYHCNKCEFDGGRHWNTRDKEYKNELWTLESSLIHGGGCACCCTSPNIVVKNINSIYHTDSWMIPIINDEEFCKTHTHSCSDKIYPTCPDCGKVSVKQYTINSIYGSHKAICTCGDGFPYTEKIVFSVLKQLNIHYIYQLTKANFDWCSNYKYDFYFELNGEQYIIETHGEQHYKEKTNFKMSLTEVQENDKIKKELAIHNGIKDDNYIILDCRKSELNWIKDNKNGILNSKLSKLFELSNINWNDAERFAVSNLVKEVCEYKNNNYLLSSEEIGNIFNLNKTTVSKYLKTGNKLNWCTYDIDFEKHKGHLKTGKKRRVPIIELTGLKIFNSIKECIELSKNIFGVQLTRSGITSVCSKRYQTTEGYKFKRIKDLTPEEYIKYGIENKLKELHKQDLVQAC